MIDGESPAPRPLRGPGHRKTVLAAGLCGALGLALAIRWWATERDAAAHRPAVASPVSGPAVGTPASIAGGGLPAIPRADPTPHVTAPPLTAEGNAALRRGLVAGEAGDLPKAVREFERAVKTDPQSPLPRDYLGMAALRQGRFEAALSQFRAEIRLSDDPATAWARVADVYYAQRNVKAAIDALERAVALRPDLAQLHYNLGMLYPQALELNKAVESLARYTALEPSNHYAQYMRGSILYKLARLDDAERALQEAIRLSPDTGLYHFALAQVCFRRTATPETTERASAELRLALDRGAPEPAAVHYYLGLCFQRKGDWDAARRELETSVRTAPSAWGAYYTLAEVLQKLGRDDDARKARTKFAVLRATEDARMKRAFYTQEVDRNPDSADAHYQLAAFLLQQGDRMGAASALARAGSLARTQKENPGLRSRIAALSAVLSGSRGR